MSDLIDLDEVCVTRATGDVAATKPTKAVEAYKGTIVSGKLAKFDAKKGATIGKKTYKYSSRYGAGSTPKTYLEDGGAVGDEVNILLSNDNFMLAIWKKPAAAPAPAAAAETED